MIKKPMMIVMSCVMAGLGPAYAADIFVSPSGDDANAGTTEAPLGSLAAAKSAAASFAGKESVIVHVADGTYYLPETLTFTPEDSGSEGKPVIYRAENEGGAVLSGGSLLDLKWEEYKDGIFQAKTPEGLAIDQLFIDGRKQRMARYPNYDPEKKAEPYQGYAADAFSKERAKNWADPAGGFIHAIHVKQWGGYHYRITGKDAEGEVTYEGGWQNNRIMGMHKDFRMVENIFEELDAESEWFHNAKTNTLYYKPTTGIDLDVAKVEVVRLRHLVEFNGSEESPVKNITLQGFVVRHAARTFMDTKEQMLRSDWTIYRGGSVKLTGTENISILDTEFDQVGGNAIFVNNYNRGTLVKGCHIHDAGASGVCFVGDPDAVRDPLFQYGEKNDLSKIDLTPGPKTNNYPSGGVVEDCLIHGIGKVERQPAGVQIEMSMKITVRDTSIYDCARAGINIGDGAWGGHLIERVDVFDTVLETHDHGSFNSWGRDRYWRSDQRSSQEAVDKNPDLPFLDAVHTTVIRDSRWSCDHGWDVDLDDGSTNYDIYNNLMLGKGLKLREGFRRYAWNNVIPFGTLHPHVWYDKSKDDVHSNIFGQRLGPARMVKPYVDETTVDRNLFMTDDEKTKKTSAALGWDENSVYGDPEFEDPAKGDFRVKEGSLALKIGFKNFPMDQFGVKKPSLKAIARTPEIPDFSGKSGKSSGGSKSKVTAADVDQFWLGAMLKDLTGEEFSAYGTKQEDGGVALENVPEASAAATNGLVTGDLVQAVNGKKVTKIADLMKELFKIGEEAIELKVIRNQQAETVAIKGVPYLLTESAENADGFKEISPAASVDAKVSASATSKEAAFDTLIDGELEKSFGPVFANGETSGMYKVDLGSTKPVSEISSWTFDKGGRGAQWVTIYGSNAKTDPGLKVSDSSLFAPLATIDTRGLKQGEFNAVSLRAADGKNLGEFRWIVWAVNPVSSKEENSAFQELQAR